MSGEMKEFLIIARFGPRHYTVGQTDNLEIAQDMAIVELAKRRKQLGKRAGARPRVYIMTVLETFGEKPPKPENN
jgi:hypothetical protein